MLQFEDLRAVFNSNIRYNCRMIINDLDNLKNKNIHLSKTERAIKTSKYVLSKEDNISINKNPHTKI